jgi:uncharacterized small protein (TIGR04563 family)
MCSSDRRKQSLYFSEGALDEIRFEAARLDRSVSWVIQRAWTVARKQVRAMPSANDGSVMGGGRANGDVDPDPT